MEIIAEKAQAPFEAVRSKDAVIDTLRHAGVASETITALQRRLPDEVDLDRDGNSLFPPPSSDLAAGGGGLHDCELRRRGRLPAALGTRKLF